MLPQKNTIQARTKSLLLQDWFCTQSDQVHHKVWYSFIVLFIPDNHQTSKEGRLLRRCADDWASGVCCILIFIQLEMKLIRIVTCFQPHLCHFVSEQIKIDDIHYTWQGLRIFMWWNLTKKIQIPAAMFLNNWKCTP